MRVRFIVYLKSELTLSSEITGMGAELPTQLPTQSPTQEEDPVMRLLLSLADGEMSSGNLRIILNIKHRQTFRDNYMHPALEDGLIEMTIPEKPSSSKQKYRLTEKGREFLGKDES